MHFREQENKCTPTKIPKPVFRSCEQEDGELSESGWMELCVLCCPQAEDFCLLPVAETEFFFQMDTEHYQDISEVYWDSSS